VSMGDTPASSPWLKPAHPTSRTPCSDASPGAVLASASHIIPNPECHMSSISAIVLGAFAVLWWLAGGHVAGYSSPVLLLVPAAMMILILVAALRTWGANDAEMLGRGRNPGRVIGIASAIEGAAIVAAVLLMVKFHRQDLSAPVIAILIGLHFVPIARGLHAKVYYLPVGLLLALGVLGFALPDLRERSSVVYVGTACVLWLTSAAVLRSSVRLTA
jgi:hypothetical protein